MEILSVAGIIGLSVVVVALSMALLGKDVPEWLSMAVGAVVLRFYNRGNGNGSKDGAKKG